MRRVDEYFEASARARHGGWPIAVKIAAMLSWLVLSWVLLMFADPGPWLAALLSVSIGLAVAGVGFCVMHDANHGAYFRRRRYNHLLGWTADTLLGLSSYAWRVKHNVAHHTYTNVDGYDADITQMPFARMMPVQAPKPWYRLQHLYIWPLYTLMAIRWQTLGDAAAFLRGRIGESALRVPRGWDLAGLLVGKAIFVTWTIAVPLLFYPWWAVAVGFLAFSMVMSLIMAVTFQLAHCVEEADFAGPGDLAAEKRLWAVHEVETTVDFCPRNPVLTWMLGGLNFQIEHHLFPRVPHTHYARIARIVQENAARHGVRYSVQPSLAAALRSHYRHLRTMGRLGLPVEIEMG